MISTSPATPWWQESTAYQIYPRSFCDSNGDGIGDLEGILSRLDYLHRLGIGFIWLSPVYRSPMVDNGYDISDYEAIAPEYGTMADLDKLIEAARDRDIGIVMDLVVNHTSDEHAWFVDSRQSRTSACRDFYIWRDPAPNGGPPNELQSFFGGSAWELDPTTGQYYLHLFDRRQPDLNWTNPRVRQAIHRMMNRWLDRGIAGFRMDVIDLIGKDVDRGITADGPKLHDYLQELYQEALAGRDIVTIGETWSATPESALLYSGRERGELSMIFQFEHVTQQWDATLGKWKPKAFDLVALKSVIDKWQQVLADDGWNSLFWGNHDLPRAVSKYGSDGVARVRSAKMLAIALHLLKGTPYIYQGEEFGMTNAAYADIDQYRDVETLTNFRLHQEAGLDVGQFLQGARENSRDNARTPMQWSSGLNAGFSSGTPWIDVNPNYRTVNAAEAEADEQSIFACYSSLCRLRRQLPIIVSGRYRPIALEHPAIMAYERALEKQRLLVIANFTNTPLTFELPEQAETSGRCLICNDLPRHSASGTIELAAFEAFAILDERAHLP